MSGVATAIAGAAVVGAYVSYQSGQASAEAAEAAAETSAGGQREGLAYLQEVEAMPRAFREAALTQLGAEYGFTFDEEGNLISGGESIADRASSSPFFTGAQSEAEEAILRNAPGTGGLRSGNVQDALARANQDLYTQSYLRELQGLEGLAGLPSYARDIAGVQTGIGQTLGAGQIAAAQAEQAGAQGIGTALTGATSNLLLARGQGQI